MQNSQITPARVGIVDDHRTFAEAITLALDLAGDLQVVFHAADAVRGYQGVQESGPDIVVVDYRLSGAETGLDLIRSIRSAADPRIARTPIVMLTGYLAPSVFRNASLFESVSVLSKESSIKDIVGVIRSALLGSAECHEPTRDPFGLTPAELEVLEYVAAGLNATEISRLLVLSIHAIRARIKGTLRKLGVSSQLEAVAKATSYGLVVPAHGYRVDGPEEPLAPAV